jgi:hypothetical protein
MFTQVDLIDGCITITRSETVGYNLDTLCLVMTDPITGITDTTVGIFSNLPVRDTIRDTNTVTTLDTLCMNVNPGMNADTVIITNCNGGPLTTVNTYNTLVKRLYRNSTQHYCRLQCRYVMCYSKRYDKRNRRHYNSNHQQYT